MEAKKSMNKAAYKPVVMIVNCSPIQRDYASQILLRAGYKVLQAGDGTGADIMEQFRQGQPDLVLLSYNISNTRGFNYLEAFQLTNELVPVIVQNSSEHSSNDGDYRKFRNCAGVVDSVPERGALKAIVKQVLSQEQGFPINQGAQIREMSKFRLSY